MSESIQHSALVSELKSLSWSDVKCMAIHLDRMDLAVLDKIEEDHPNDAKQRVMYAMKEWLQRDTEASWRKVVGALREINKNALATEIEKKYCAAMTTPHLLEPTPLSSHSASLESQPTSYATTCSTTEPLVHSLEHIAMPSQDEATSIDVSNEIQGIKSKAALLRTKFTHILIHTKICFMDKEEESRKFLRDFQVTLTSLPLFKQHEDKDFLKGEKSRIKKAKDVDQIFDILDPYWSYVDYDLLEHIIKEFGTSELQEEMKEYIAELEQFEKKTTVHDFSLATEEEVVIPACYGKLAVKLKKDPKSFTLHDVRQFKKSVENESSLKEYTLLFRRVSCSSIEIILAFPPEAHAKLLEVFKNRQFRMEHRVVSEECSGVQDVECENLLSYRRFISSFANKLEADEADQIAFIWNVSTEYSADGAFRLLLKLERQNVFSFQNPSGLIEVAKYVGREDLVQSVKEYVEMQQSSKYVGINPVPTLSEERQHLENVHDALVGKYVDLENMFQKTTVTREEGLQSVSVYGIEPSSYVQVQTPTFEPVDQISPPSRSLGIGLYGEVLEVDYKGTTYAAKEYRSGFISPEELKTIFAKKLIGLRHPNVVPYYGVCNIMGTDRYVVVMERVETNLASFIDTATRKEKREIEPQTKLSILHDVAKGLEYLHSQKPIIVHCDLKPHNILLTTKLTAKIADCGNCHVKPISNIESRQEHTLYLDYLSPEATSGDECSIKQDVFAFGHLSLYLIIQRDPHPLAKPTYRDHGTLKPRSELERRQAYIDEATQKICKYTNILHPLLEFIQQCLDDEASTRPSITKFREVLLSDRT